MTILLVLAAIFSLLVLVRPRPAALQKYLVEANTRKGFYQNLRVKFLGNTNLLFTDGETSILTDGFFSRPGPMEVLFGKLEPNPDEIRRCLERAGISQLDAVIPVHSHYDHALDAPAVAQMTGAKLIGSPSTLNIGRGYGLADSLMLAPELGKPYQIGKFKLTFVKGRHWQYPSEKMRKMLLDCAVEQPLGLPAKATDFKEGISYTILIEHEGLPMAVNGSAGFVEGALEGYRADVLFYSIAGLETMDLDYIKGYHKHLVDELGPKVVVPIHWDDFTVPLGNELKTTNLLFNLVQGADLSKAFMWAEEFNMPQREIKLLRLWEDIPVTDLFEVHYRLPPCF